MRKRFGDILLDPERHLLERGGTRVHVEPQVFDLILLLASAAPELVPYDRLIEEVWGGRIVSDATLAARISAARAAVGDDGKRQAVIRTVSRRGVQLVVPVTTEANDAPNAAPARRSCVAGTGWGSWSMTGPAGLAPASRPAGARAAAGAL